MIPLSLTAPLYSSYKMDFYHHRKSKDFCQTESDDPSTCCELILNKMLNELTHHLDVQEKGTLQGYKGTILLVSHEPEFYQD